ERAGVDPCEGGVDLAQHVRRVVLQGSGHLAVEGGGGNVPEVVVLEGGLVRLVRQRTRVLRVDVVDRVDDTLALFEELAPEVLDVDAHGFPSLRSTSAASRPRSSTTLSRPVWPETTESDVRGTCNRFASRRTTASFARPRSGADVTRTFHAEPCRP